MIDGSKKRKRQLAFELQNSLVYEKHSNKCTQLKPSHRVAWSSTLPASRLTCLGHHATILAAELSEQACKVSKKNGDPLAYSLGDELFLV